MAIAEELARLARHPGAWVGAPPASESALQELAEAVTFKLPEAYVELLRASNGGDGFLPVQPYCLCLWPAEEVRRSHDGYEVSRDAPGLFAFATSGGGELLAFDLREGPPHPIVAIPCIGMALEHALPVAPDFDALIGLLGREPAA
jgi:hypothetical protein